MYGAVATIFVISLAIGFVKSTRAIIVLGGLLTMIAIVCGIYLRKYELLDTVLEYVKTQGKSVFSTPSEWDRMQLLGVGVIVAIIVLGAICFVVDAAKESKTSVVFLVAVISFMASFHLSDKRDIVASWNDVSSEVVINGSNQHRDILVNDSDAKVRHEVAVWGNTRHRDMLVHDEDFEVRADVVRNGNHRHHNILVNDSNAYVRRMVAIYGSDKHRKILSHDKGEDVRIVASQQLEIPAWLLYR